MKANLSDLMGQTLVRCENIDNEQIVFQTSEGRRYALRHHQDCCEYVRVEDIVGDLQDLVGSPILVAEEVTNAETPTQEPAYSEGSGTWTFYKLATLKGYVDIRWFGTSNGYYSESVDFDEITKS